MAGHLAFWMANSSEFLHFLKQDVELSGMTEESQKILAHTTQQAFRSLVQCIKAELHNCLPAFLDPSEESDLDEHGENGVDEKFDPMEGYQSTERSFKVRQYGPHGQPLGGDQWMGKNASSTIRLPVLFCSTNKTKMTTYIHKVVSLSHTLTMPNTFLVLPRLKSRHIKQ